MAYKAVLFLPTDVALTLTDIQQGLLQLGIPIPNVWRFFRVTKFRISEMDSIKTITRNYFWVKNYKCVYIL